VRGPSRRAYIENTAARAVSRKPLVGPADPHGGQQQTADGRTQKVRTEQTERKYEVKHWRLGLALALAALSSLAATAEAAAQELDWEKYAHVGVIEIITVDPDGDVRETKVWFVTIDGAAYLRTSGSRWLANIERDPKVVIRIEDRELPQLAHAVTGEVRLAGGPDPPVSHQAA
jgi:hypothetical protein